MRLSDVSPQQSKKIKESGRIAAPPSPGQGYKGTLTVVTAQDDDTILLPDFIELLNGKIMRLRKFDAVVRRHKFKSDKDEHEFFFSELLLFYPWRDESELFPDDANKCRELYLAEKINIDKVKRKLFPHLAEVELGRAMVESFDEHEQVGIEVDPEGEQEKDQDLISEVAAEYGGLDPEGLEEEENLKDGKGAAAPFFRAPPVLEMDELKERTRKLAWEQLAVLQRVLDYCMNLVMSRHSVRRPTVKPPLMIIHGGAGTGKSTLINNISLWVQKLMITAGDDTDCPYLLRLAPTGMAASNIQGQTLHSGLKFKFGNKFESLSDKTRDNLRDQYKNVKVIIIDEMSMIRSDQLFHLHLCLQEIMNNDLVFGGLSLLLLGDLMQLKPCRGNYIYQEPADKHLKEVFGILNLWELFDVYILEENHRQGEDREYADLLNRLRFKSKEDDLSVLDTATLSSRISEPQNLDNTTQIFGYNKSVNLVNENKLKTLQKPLHIIEAEHFPARRNINIKPAGTIESTAFLQKLSLKVGARVMLIHNINTEDGLTNGAQGIIEDIIVTNGKVTCVMIKFDNTNVGHEHRRKFRSKISVPRSEDITPIEKYHHTYTLGDVSKNHEARASFFQFPLKLSWATSAHKVNFLLNVMSKFIYFNYRVRDKQ